MKLKNLSLYIHIPFCVKKCLYCDFLSFSQSESKQKEYINALIKEIKKFKNKNKYNVKTIFIGGGTPSSIKAEYIMEIMDLINSEFSVDENAEITIEANPGTINRNNALIYKKCGINRISLGLQAVQNRLLSKLGRIHSFEEFKESFEILREVGFNNINVDLMFALPTQSLKDWEESLLTIARLNPEHISCYSLIIEEGTPFYDMAEKIVDFQTSDENDRLMYYKAKEILKENGYEQYEISNFSKPNYFSRHNAVYWKRGDYIGFGLGASSFLDNFRFKNTEDMNSYLNGADYEEEEEIKDKTAYSEFMFLGLRMTQGISIKEFENCFGLSIFDVYDKEIIDFISKGFLIKNNDRIYLSEKGIDISNQIFVEFL